MNLKPFRFPEGYNSEDNIHYHQCTGCPECVGKFTTIAYITDNGSKRTFMLPDGTVQTFDMKEDINKTFYFNNYQDKLYAFKELNDRIIKLINSNKSFKVEISELKETGLDPYLQTK